ncbi:MAG: ribosome biogenesis GTPase Der [Acidobacteria bacterium]|nr:ribosome biogenesis GTPase Der [Acidobacteriota bacterium]
MNQSSGAVSLPQVAIVGRPNVGKSTLFNRIVGRREAIVGSQHGMTRDRNTAETDWNGVSFGLIDTGGIDQGSKEDLLRRVEEQVMFAIDIADIVLLVVDGRQGPLPVEHEIASQLRRRGITLILAINKCDQPETADEMELAFHEVGIELMYVIAAEHGFGVADLLDTVTDLLPEAPIVESEEDPPIRVAFVGRPNVGKSSLVNTLLGSERVIVNDQPGTTRDPIDTLLESNGRRYVLVDTAGIRKRARIDTHAEIASVAMARRRMTQADIALLVIDADEGVTHQDLHVAADANRMGCGLIVVVNKWDLVDEEEESLRPQVEENVRERLGRMRYARVAVTSATEGTGIEALLPLVDEVAEARRRRVPTADLNVAFAAMVGRHAPAGGTSAAHPKYLTQVGVNPPRFVAFAGGRGAARGDYTRYLENRLRASFDFAGSPVVIKLRRSRRKKRRARRR